MDLASERTPSAANDPLQLLLMACGGCVMLDVVDILAKKREPFDRLEFEIEALRRDSPPKIVRRLDYHVNIIGAVREESIRRAMELSLTKYCSVSLSLDRSVRFFVQIRLNGSTGESREIPRNSDWFAETPATDTSASGS